MPEEGAEAAVVIAGEAEAGLWARGAPPFFHVKGVVERVLSLLGIRSHFRPDCDEPYLHPGAAACFLAGKRQVAALGELHPETAKAFGIEVPIAVATLNLDHLLASPRPEAKFREVSRFPSVRRDYAVLFDSSVAGGTVLEAIRKAAGSLLTGAEIFDRYEGKGVPKGKVSLAFRLVFQKVDRTLKDEEVNEASERVVQVLQERFHGELR